MRQFKYYGSRKGVLITFDIGLIDIGLIGNFQPFLFTISKQECWLKLEFHD